MERRNEGMAGTSGRLGPDDGGAAPGDRERLGTLDRARDRITEAKKLLESGGAPYQEEVIRALGYLDQAGWKVLDAIRREEVQEGFARREATHGEAPRDETEMRNPDWYIEAWMREYRDWQAANPKRSLFAFPLEWFRQLCGGGRDLRYGEW